MISSVQCCVPDLNCDSASSVWHTGPQPRLCEFSVACRTAPVMERIGSSCRKSGQRSSCKMSQDKSDRMSGDMFARKNKTIDKQLTHQLLTVPNPHRTGKLQGMLLVHENMIVRLSDVLAPHLGLVKDKMAMVVKVDLHHEDQERLRHRETGFCHFVPEYMAKGIWVKLLK